MHLCRDDAVKKAEEAGAEAASSRQQVSAAAERAASLRSKMESLRAEADAARQACSPSSSSPLIRQIYSAHRLARLSQSLHSSIFAHLILILS